MNTGEYNTCWFRKTSPVFGCDCGCPFPFGQLPLVKVSERRSLHVTGTSARIQLFGAETHVLSVSSESDAWSALLQAS